jgi:orotate phosphoribosyltransferase
MMLNQNQSKFLDVLLRSGALQFGSFKTKSGRMSPFFLNSGAFDSGNVLHEVAECYAHVIKSVVDSIKLATIHLYGPAYKGITLAAAAAVETSRLMDRDVAFTFNRKEKKDHGEGGVFIGRNISSESQLLIIEDVMTGGTSIRETLELLKSTGASVKAVVIGVDRMEIGSGKDRASLEISKKFNIPVYSILTIDEIVEALWSDRGPIKRLGKEWITNDLRQDITTYRLQWGV